MKLYIQVRTVAICPENVYVFSLIQGIDQFLLDICIELIVKRIDADRLFKNLREVCPDFRDRKGDDRKTTVGCGDSMIAGFALGLSEGLSLEETLRRASAISAASAMREETGFFVMEDMEKLLPQIEITRL